MTNFERQCAYLAQLRAFKNYMDSVFDVLMNDGATYESVTLFYNSDFEIKFRGKTATLFNGAEVFQRIDDIIQGEIDEYEEVI